MFGDVMVARQEHQKHAVVGRWAPDGSFYATGSHDKSAKLYRYNHLAADGQPRSELAREVSGIGAAVATLCDPATDRIGSGVSVG